MQHCDSIRDDAPSSCQPDGGWSSWDDTAHTRRGGGVGCTCPDKMSLCRQTKHSQVYVCQWPACLASPDVLPHQ